MDEQFKQLHRTQKAGFLLLTLFAFCVLVLGAYQFRTTIYGPFALAPLSRERTELAAIDELFRDDTMRLQLLDTDGDGISDYDELYLYGTSPYLIDTDSDGVNDYDEIFVYTTDPICPTGADCEIFNPTEEHVQESAEVGISQLFTDSVETSGALFDSIAEVATIGEALEEMDGQGTLASSTVDFSMLPPESQAAVLQVVSDPDTIRELLRQSSTFSEEEIASFSDELLLQMVLEVLE